MPMSGGMIRIMLKNTGPACQGKVFVQQVPSSPFQPSKNKNHCVYSDLVFTTCALPCACEKRKRGIVALGDTPEFCDIRGSFCLTRPTAHPMPMRVYGQSLSDSFVMKKGEIFKKSYKIHSLGGVSSCFKIAFSIMSFFMDYFTGESGNSCWGFSCSFSVFPVAS